jgi:quercetin dioxygenase-like cupin family protein
MQIARNGSQPSGKGPAEYFTGAVRVDPLFQVPDPGRVTGGLVTFEPGARSNWHTHPRGQTLIVTCGVGWTQCWGKPKQEIRPGDVIWCARRPLWCEHQLSVIQSDRRQRNQCNCPNN